MLSGSILATHFPWLASNSKYITANNADLQPMATPVASLHLFPTRGQCVLETRVPGTTFQYECEDQYEEDQWQRTEKVKGGAKKPSQLTNLHAMLSRAHEALMSNANENANENANANARASANASAKCQMQSRVCSFVPFPCFRPNPGNQQTLTQESRIQKPCKHEKWTWLIWWDDILTWWAMWPYIWSINRTTGLPRLHKIVYWYYSDIIYFCLFLRAFSDFRGFYDRINTIKILLFSSFA